GDGARDGDFGASLHHGRTAPREIFPKDLRKDPQEEGRAVLDRLADRGLVHEGWTEGDLVLPLTQAKARVQRKKSWIPASAGMSEMGESRPHRSVPGFVPAIHAFYALR